MTTQQELLDTIVELAKEVDGGDPIDFADIPVDEDAMFRLAAANVIEIYERTADEDREVISLATMTKLVVENMALNMRLHRVGVDE